MRLDRHRAASRETGQDGKHGRDLAIQRPRRESRQHGQYEQAGDMLALGEGETRQHDEGENRRVQQETGFRWRHDARAPENEAGKCEAGRAP